MSDGAITGMKHTHLLVVFIFVLNYLFKAILLFTGQTALLEKVRKYTKVPIDMVFPLIFIGTGLAMAMHMGMGNLGGWFHMKLTLVVLVIPMAIIGMKKSNKPLVAISSLILIYLIVLAFSKSIPFM